MTSCPNAESIENYADQALFDPAKARQTYPQVARHLDAKCIKCVQRVEVAKNTVLHYFELDAQSADEIERASAAYAHDNGPDEARMRY